MKTKRSKKTIALMNKLNIGVAKRKPGAAFCIGCIGCIGCVGCIGCLAEN